MPTSRVHSAKAAWLMLLDEAFERKAWHGPNLKGALRGVTAQQAAWRPAPGRHNIWELAIHAAYWKYAVRRRLTGEKRGSFGLNGSNWFQPPSEPDSATWKRHLGLLASEHKLLRQVIEALPRSAWADANMLKLIRGIASHDLYHAGQVQLLKRLWQSHSSR